MSRFLFCRRAEVNMALDERLSGIAQCKDQISFSSLKLAWLW